MTAPSTLVSMTGFARAEGVAGPWRWAWELKSVNGRNFDLRLRLPQGAEALEPVLRQRAAAVVRRGNVQANLHLNREGATSELRVNEDALAQVLTVLARLEKQGVSAHPPSYDGILALRGVLETGEPEETEAERDAREAALLAGFDEALAALDAARRAEGAHLAAILRGQIDTLAALVGEAETCAAAQPDYLRARLKKQVEELAQTGVAVSEDRLAQEVALLVTRIDVREEIDRLKAHLEQARELLASAEAVGRRLDFLTQEFNREANTLCSKAQDVTLKRVGLEMKSIIDQMREQVQNVE
jgi:uncharacterized protein (TIGR00255 family)